MSVKCKLCQDPIPEEYSSDYETCPECDWELSHQDNYDKSNYNDCDDKRANEEYYEKQKADEKYEEYRRYGGENPLGKSDDYFSSSYNYIHGNINPY
jgi:hypothetical protein